MKSLKLQIASLFTVGSLLFVLSCSDFLEIPAVGQLSESMLTTASGIDLTLIGAYGHVNGRNERMASPSNWVWGGIRGGDANKGTDPGDFLSINFVQRYEVLSNLDIVEQNWRGIYEGIARTNLVLRLVARRGPDVTNAQALAFEAQARFLRAHFYFELFRNFNRVPIFLQDDDFGTPRFNEIRNDQEMLPFIEAEMRFAAENLPPTQPQVGRVNAWAARAYLGKILLYAKKYAEAKQVFDDVIANGVTSNGLRYGLVPNYGDLFRGANNNSQESVWAFQSAINTGTTNNANPEFDLIHLQNGPGGCCGFYQPSFTFVNSFRTANGLPLLDMSFNSVANRLANDMGLGSTDPFTPDAGPVDPRLDHTVGRRGIPYLDWGIHPGRSWVRNQGNAGPFSPRKYIFAVAERGVFQDNSSWTPGYTGINFMIIRFADVLLMAAEAEVELGNLETARAHVNRIRARAQNSRLLLPNGQPAANYQIELYNSPWTNATTARNAVRFERNLELGMEGKRFYDLVRWGIAKQYIDFYLAHDSQFLSGALGGAVFTAGRDELLPIPENQLDLMGRDRIRQNPGF